MGAADPIKRYEQRLGAEHGFSEDELASIREDREREVAEAAERALASPTPDPELALEGVFAGGVRALGDGQAPWSFWSERADRGSREEAKVA